MRFLEDRYTADFLADVLSGGVQLVGIGVLGEYIGRIYLEARQRPRYIVRRTLNHQKTPNPTAPSASSHSEV